MLRRRVVRTSTLMSSATQVASGTTDGHSWSLWSANGESGASALEDGGLVLDGHEFGICPGYPNPAELEMLNVDSQAIVYGVIGYPGLATLNLSVGTIGSFATGARCLRHRCKLLIASPSLLDRCQIPPVRTPRSNSTRPR